MEEQHHGHTSTRADSDLEGDSLAYWKPVVYILNLELNLDIVE